MKKISFTINYCAYGKKGTMTSKTAKLKFRFIDKYNPKLQPLYLRALEIANFTEDNKITLMEQLYRDMGTDFIIGLSCSRFSKQEIREILLDIIAVYHLNCQIAANIIKQLYETDTLEIIRQISSTNNQAPRNLACYLQSHGTFEVYRKYIDLLFTHKDECFESAHISVINQMADYYRDLYD